ncbi:FkbM family methyltransferase [Variovorax sp. YR752]|uniref:FkbM family methyltransferase n=1 Tax=Variovorax sp. YR752 TaxID=1884383 RepID=UPI003137F86C
MASAKGSVEDFLDDIEPFFYGRRLTFVDVGAYRGEVFKKLKSSRLKVREAHLVEPNPESVTRLRSELSGLLTERNVHIHAVAMGATSGRVRLRGAQDMTKVVAAAADAVEDPDAQGNLFEVQCVTLDELSQRLTEPHISLLKIDVEGFETEVLKGAPRLLENQSIDMLYIEAGMNPGGTQQAYFRDIDDILLRYGYRMFRIYEQTTEWIVDSPLLRRVNIAYMSSRFAQNNPYRLTQELFQARRQLEEAGHQAKELKEASATLERRIAGIEAQNRQAQLDATAQQRALSQRCEELRIQLLEAQSRRHEIDVAEYEALKRHTDALEAELRARDERLATSDSQIRELEQHVQSTTKLLGDARVAENALIAKLGEANQSELALRTKLDQAERACQVCEEMSRDLLQGFDELRLSERRAQADARMAHLREERTRRRLANRLGTVILENARRPWAWWKMPAALIRMYSEYRRDKAQGLLAPPVPPSDQLQLRKGRLASVPKSHWQTVALPESSVPSELWLTPLCVSARGTTTIEFSSESPATCAQFIRSGSVDPATASRDPTSTVALTLVPGRSVMLLSTFASAGSIQFRKIRGLACVLKFDMRAGRVEQMAAEAASSSAERPMPEEQPLSRSAAGLRAPEPMVPGTVAVDEPKRMKSAILWQAFQMVTEGQVDRGIAFAERHARDFVRPAISLLKANREIGNDAQWLRHVNDYLRQFDIEPITLEPSGGTLFSRLSTRPIHRIENGPLISVIMPAFEAERTLWSAARSILNQSWSSLELIIVDDCSSDHTWEIIEKLKRSDPRVKALRNRANVGPYVSKNLALSIATGEFITGHDADDWAHPQRLALQVQEMLKSGGKIKASMTRMVRLNDSGYFGHFAKEGKTSDDGALRDAAISCMFEATYMRRHLGYWDSVRFGADSELISRAEYVLGNGFAKFRQLAMLCLDVEGSLTNDPVHGVSKLHGISPTRRFYREQWTEWHQTIDLESAYLPFPHQPRRFVVPEAAAVSDGSLTSVLQDLAAERIGSLDPTPQFRTATLSQ